MSNDVCDVHVGGNVYQAVTVNLKLDVVDYWWLIWKRLHSFPFLSGPYFSMTIGSMGMIPLPVSADDDMTVRKRPFSKTVRILYST